MSSLELVEYKHVSNAYSLHTTFNKAYFNNILGGDADNNLQSTINLQHAKYYTSSNFPRHHWKLHEQACLHHKSYTWFHKDISDACLQHYFRLHLIVKLLFIMKLGIRYFITWYKHLTYILGGELRCAIF